MPTIEETSNMLGYYDEYLGEHHGQRIEIVEQLHVKDQKRS